ncbi:E3 ubiquitin-protein ligase RFWD3-like [Maniola jurtina]|uniref:E3 ubiquitin-protein ligase RFWD3-like n=1 Tax=Maniola jurtina TaxID=191418 RepID=UPI001E68B134|nr:E3 ubiquitin-protein ligase RFWD3-like [Maniola jurtina]
MDNSQISSSPSILVPESPESSTPSSPESPALQSGYQPSETFTEPDINEDNSQVVVADDFPEVGEAVWCPGRLYDNADLAYESNMTSNPAQETLSNDSNQSQPVSSIQEPWRPNLGVINNDTESNDDARSPVSEPLSVSPLIEEPWRGAPDISEEASSRDSDQSQPVSPIQGPWRPSLDVINEDTESNDVARSPVSEPLSVSPLIGEPWRGVPDISEEALPNDSNQSQLIQGPWRPNLNVINENTLSNGNARSPVPEPLSVSPPIEGPWRPVVEGSSEEAHRSDKRSKDAEGCEEPPTKVRKLDTSVQEDGETCPICLDSWSNSGPHRLVALKCGHLFGAQCVERWLRAQPARERRCPSCKSKATIKDMRFIYAKKLVAADASQITALQAQLEILQQEKNRTEHELQKSRIAHRSCMLQLEDLRKSLLKTNKEQPVRKTWRFALEKNLEVNRDGGCRVMTYDCRTYELYVSQKSTNPLFPGYGIRKVSCVDYTLGQFLHLHPKPIRDITYSQPRDLLLSVGLDNTARIVERGILRSTIQCGVPLWSCTWDCMRGGQFYVGGTGGVIQHYDTRNSGRCLEKFTIGTDLSPVVSLVSTEHGLLSCQLNSCWLWTWNSRQWDKKSLPVEGPFMSLCYDKESHRVLVSGRAGAERAKLHLCKVKSGYSDVVEYEQVFSGSARTSVMCRSAFVKVPGSMWVASHSESDSSLDLYGLDGCRSMRLPASEPAVAVCAAHGGTDTLVASLSEARLRLYRAQPSS